ncbi:protein PEP-RELATED DEVELOPMENT ARRESTED 1, chloroplastic [Malania oleifera]|uniref:protein PEP-RELATED DEVELOPMENT ARRESTED 1, chloroplastic n=1 Tax=Malania oleifera TaxID=397392 RepID=UPI0025AE25A7|nr:protein PEP-RELATED DEVELOPMENT ARRESTED 1, chloroplastic [Malania oleifera]
MMPNKKKKKEKKKTKAPHEILNGRTKIRKEIKMLPNYLLYPIPPSTISRSYNLLSPLSFFCSIPSFRRRRRRRPCQRLRELVGKHNLLALCTSYEVGGGFTSEGFDAQAGSPETQEKGNRKWSTAEYEALLKGGEQVTSVLQEMVTLLEDMNMDEASEKVAVELAAQGVIGKRVDEMETGFMMALEYMIQIAEKDQDDKRKSLLEVIKETVLSHLTKKCPPQVQVVGLLCRTPQKESRHELLCRVAGGGGVFKGENGTKVHIPGANLNDIANQADDILETMESRPVVPDRKLLARLVLIREEARNLMGGGILDERNDRGFSTLPESEVNFLTKLVALKPGKTVREMIKNVMLGKDEGADHSSSDGEDASAGMISGGIAGRPSVTGRKPRPVRPGMFLETVTKVLGGIYDGNVSGITAQHLEWVHQKTLQVLQEIAF